MLTAAEEREEYAEIVRGMAELERRYGPVLLPPVLVSCVCVNCGRAFRVVEAAAFCSGECVGVWQAVEVPVGGESEFPW